MTSMIQLRPYQREAIDAVSDAHHDGMLFPAVVLPTGAGKTVVFAHQAAEHIKAHKNRVLIIVHRDEIADNTIRELYNVAPELKVGKVKADDDEIFADVVVASVQTASRPERLDRLVRSQFSSPDRRPRRFGLVITDEVHHGITDSYTAVYAAFEHSLKVGYTATLARGDEVGLGSLISDVVYSRSLLWMIKQGYLVDPVGQVASVEHLDLRRVRRSGGDYTADSLGAAMIDAGAPAVISAAYAEHAGERSGIVFMPNVASAHETADVFNAMGITADVVDGSTPREDRRLIYKQSRTGDLQVIVNCAVLTEGANFPWVSAVVPRMTMSQPLFQQMVGRALRTWPGKNDALVLSVGGMSGKLRTLVDLEPGSVKRVRPGESLVEAEAREEAEANRIASGGTTKFAIKVKHADMFAASRSAWLRTEGGVMFIPVTDGEVFLWPGPGDTWQVRHAPHATTKLRVRWPVIREGLTLDMAMAWGETEAEDRDHGSFNGRAASVSTRASRWRKDKSGPTQGQLAACSIRGIEVPRGATKAEVSDLLSVWVASRKFDPFAARLAARTAVVSAT